ncbi:MAG: serine hydrolase domain-containing protein [Acidimicrobiales bacterium]
MTAALARIDGWPPPHAAVGVASREGTRETRGPVERPFRWASVTKVLTAGAVLAAVEAGLLDLDEAAGPPGATVRHLLAHASGLPTDAGPPLSPPGRRRIYSNAGFEVLGRLVEGRVGTPFAAYLAEAVLGPLGLGGTRLDGSPASGAIGPLDDLLLLGAALLEGGRDSGPSWAEAVRPAFPGLAGVLPGFGRQDPNDWGLGFELRGAKSPHWMGATNSPRTFGHFGRSGGFLWVDPDAGLVCAFLSDLDFGPWAAAAWPSLSDAVIAEFAPGSRDGSCRRTSGAELPSQTRSPMTRLP